MYLLSICFTGLMDKSWMSKSKWSSDYIEEVKLHLLSKGIFPGYVVWNRHGEEHACLAEVTRSDTCTDTSNVVEVQTEGELHRSNDIEGLLRDTFCSVNANLDDEHNENNIDLTNDEAMKYGDLLLEAGSELYPGCKSFTKLSFILHLFRLKCLHSWSARSFDQLIELLIEAFSDGSLLPKNTYEVKKIMKVFDLGYIKIDACPNDCCLFWKDRSIQEVCHICGSSRWIGAKKSSARGKKNQMKSAKVVRYFPLIPRLQRLFKTKKSAEEMIWHAKQRNIDGLLRHPADGEAWKSFDSRYPDFASDPRNVRLALASDGFNPFKLMSSTYSIWPILLVPYNMPPWIAMKQSSFILSTIIPGEKSPGNNIDIYIQPLINELTELWHGVISYDAASGQSFNLRAALMWTINDFPAYGMLSGWSTKGRFACPCCAENTESLWLYKGKKFSYMGHRRWLPENHLFRRQKQYFDNTEEIRKAPRRNTGSDILQKLQNVQFDLGKSRSLKRGRTVEFSEHHIWKKKSIFFELPYWEYNLLPHNLDVMHIEKNKMAGGSRFRQAKKVVCRGGSSRGGSSRGETSRETESITPSTSVHPDSQEEIECSGTQQASQHSFGGAAPATQEGIWLVDEQGNPSRRRGRRGRTTCADIQNMPPGTRIHIEVNENNIPCNIPESTLLGTYLGVVARDPVLAPISFPDWRNKGMEPYKKKMLAEVESKFEFPGHIRHWILQSLGVKWRNHKTTLKAEHWDSRPIEEILETVPAGVDQLQWCQLVNKWSKPEDQAQACNLLAQEGLTPEEGNIEANERVFAIVMGPEHSGRVRTQGFGVTPTRFFPQSKNEEGSGSGSSFGQIASLREEFISFRDNQAREFASFRDEMRQFMQETQRNHPPHGGSEMGGNDNLSDA
ncbi:hypothetical protein KFK09_026343 [Dendrobium nobile]|uniref:Transposase n=1 Tax=Dendrobium nobile TaxID=94219 RepID=A0A8T3A7I8_DENNO|nr:hypothetical protein KFK09_026343 [Dendrobium nobile]